MPRINVSRQVLNKHFVSTLVGQPITEFLIRKGSNPGDGIAGSILSLDVRTTSGEIINLIYKSMSPITPEFVTGSATPTESSCTQNSESKFRAATEIYSVEIQFYQKIAPAIEEITKEPLPIPKLYSADNNDTAAYLVLEDLRPIGYKMGDKNKGLNLPEVTLVLKTLSKFHAQSYVLLQRQGNVLFNDEKSSVFTEKHALTTRKGIALEGLIEMAYQNTKEILRKRRGAEIADRMAKFDGKVHQTILRPWKETDEKYFPILNHGDLWVNNLMFLYDGSENPKDVKFIDFQQCRRGNIYDDLLYFLLCSTTPEFRAQNLNLCLETYFEEFSSTLETLDVPLPERFSLEILRQHFQENLGSGFCYFAFAVSFQLGVFVPPPSPATPLQQGKGENSLIYNFENPEQSNSAEGFVEDLVSALKGAMENSEKAVNRLESIVKEMVDLGVL